MVSFNRILDTNNPRINPSLVIQGIVAQLGGEGGGGGEMVNKFNLIHTEAGSSSGPVSCPLSSVLSLAADICLMALT